MLHIILYLINFFSAEQRKIDREEKKKKKKEKRETITRVQCTLYKQRVQ